MMLRDSDLATFEAVGALVVVLDVDRRVVYCNRACSDLTGYTLDELRGRPFLELLRIPEEANAVSTAFASRGDTHPAAFSNYWVCKNGERRWIVGTDVSIAGPDGRTQYIVKTGIDQSDRKEVEDGLGGIISSAIDAVISIDSEQRLVLYNRGAEHIFGWRASEVLGKPLEMLLPARFKAAHGYHVRNFESNDVTTRHMAEGRPEIYGLRKNGDEFPAQASISRLEVAGRTIFTVVLRDVTDQRRREREREFLLEASAVLDSSLDYGETLTNIARFAVEDFADCCIVDTVDTDGRLRRKQLLRSTPSKMAESEIIRRIPVDQQLTNLTVSAIAAKDSCLMSDVSSTYLEWLSQSEEDAGALQELIRSAIVVPMRVRGESLGAITLLSSRPERRYDSGDLRLAEDFASRAALALENARLYERSLRVATDLRAANEEMAVATVRAQELTDAAEAAREQVEKSERELRAVGELRDMFIGIVGHDLRNPLGAIEMSAELMIARAKLDAQDSEAVARIIRSSRRMTRMIAQLLDLTRVRLGGGFPLEVNPVDLREVCHRTLEEFATSTTLQIVGDVRGIWDADRLEEVLSNIVGNAVEHAAPGTAVVVEVHPDGQDVVVAISNQGNPIPPDILPHIFDPFRRGVQIGKSVRGNLGLGLYIAYQIVSAHRGMLEASSSNGVTTFSMRLPRTQQAQQAAHGYQEVELSDAVVAGSMGQGYRV